MQRKQSSRQAMEKCPLCNHLMADHSIAGCRHCKCGQMGEGNMYDERANINYEDVVGDGV